MEFKYKHINYEALSVALFGGLAPITILSIGYGMDCIVKALKNNPYSSPGIPFYVALAILAVSIVISLFIIIFSKKQTVYYDDNIIKFDDTVIYIKNIKKVSYQKMPIFLLPLLFAYKCETGMLLEIKYDDEEGYHKKYTDRITYSIFRKLNLPL